MSQGGARPDTTIGRGSLTIRPEDCGTALRAQKGEHGENAPVVLGRRRQAELAEDVGHVLLDCSRRDEEQLADRLVRAALGHELEYLALARREPLNRVVAAVAADEFRDDERI